MSQFDYGTIDPTTKSGSVLATDLNSFRDALHSTHKGPAAPSYAVAGLHWIDDTGDPIWLLKAYDGADWIVVAVFDATNNVSYPVSVNPVLTYPTAGGSANALTLTPAIPMTAYANRAKVTFTAASNNSGAATLNVSGVGAKAIRTIASGTDIALVAGNLQAGRKYEAVYSSSANSGAGAWIVVGLLIGTTAGTVASGDDARIAGALQKSAVVGGTTGQALVKNSDDDYDFKWANSGGGTIYQEFLSSGTLEEPEGLTENSLVFVEIWAAGGGGSGPTGSRGGGGGGGAYNSRVFKASEITWPVSITIGAGGVGITSNNAGNSGGNSSFGSYLSARGGEGGNSNASRGDGGGGGGITSQGSGSVGGGPVMTGGRYGGDGSQSAASDTMHSTWGGGGGGGQAQPAGGNSIYGGGGGHGGSNAQTAGVSIFGGNGGGTGNDGQVPGGGGGNNGGNGGAGKCTVRVIR